jgi:predicted transcriptional regulator
VKKTVLMAVAGMIALAGAAMAEQTAFVNANLHAPDGDHPIVTARSPGLSQPEAVPSQGDTIDGLNEQLEPTGAQVRLSDNHVQSTVQCQSPPDPALQPAFAATCNDEPGADLPANPLVSVDQDGAHLSRYVQVDSKDTVMKFTPDAVPEDQKQPLTDLNDAVNAAVQASIDDSALGECSLLCIYTPIGDVKARHHLGMIVGGGVSELPAVGDGNEAPWLFGGDEPLADTPGLQAGATEGGDALAQTSGDGGAGPDGGDLGTMAVMAAVVGGAILAPMALYHRIRKDHTLNNKTRQAVYDGVVQSPGIGVNEAAKAAGCSYSTAAYHLERLVEERLLVVGEDGRRARFFKNGGAFSQQEREFVPILQSKECMNVLQVVVENPWCYRAEVAQKLGVSGPTVNWHLKKLMGAGVVKEMREGRVSYLYADKKLLAQVGANLVGKLPEDLVARLRFERRPEAELVEPALALPETGVPDIGVGEELELAPIAEA